MELNHQIFGKISYNYGWTQDITVTIFGKKSVLEMNIDADADGEFEVNQERAYIFFKEHLDEIIKESNTAIVSYYNNALFQVTPILAKNNIFWIKLETRNKFILC